MAYVTLEEFKEWLDEPDGTYDNQMRAAIAAAEAMVDRFMGRSIGAKATTERVYGTGGGSVFPSRTPVSAVTSCVVDGRAVDVGFTDISVFRRDGGSFGSRDEILLTYTAGEAAIPEDVKTATKITAQAIYSAADLDANMTGENAGGVMGGNFQPGGPGSIPRAAQTILSPYRRVHGG